MSAPNNPPAGSPAPGLPRCNRCGWPLVFDAKGGCTPGNCAQRPLPPIRNQYPSSVSASIVLTLDESTELIALAARQAHERAEKAEAESAWLRRRLHALRAALMDVAFDDPEEESEEERAQRAIAEDDVAEKAGAR